MHHRRSGAARVLGVPNSPRNDIHARLRTGTPSRFVLETTETAVIYDPTAAARTIGALRALGVSVVIDDFGTGYTSPSFLRHHQIDGLKIDRCFVSNLDHGSAAIIDAIVRMSADLGLKVIAEGIETEAHLVELSVLGCRFVQGYLTGPPMKSDTLRRRRPQRVGPFSECRTQLRPAKKPMLSAGTPPQG